nr:FAD-binding protein [Cohnella faecalis]
MTPVTLVQELHRIIEDPARVSIDQEVIRRHGNDITSYHRTSCPDVVVYPICTKEISDILVHANERSIPVVPCGALTSVEGQVVPVCQGISLSLTRMNEIIKIRPQDFLVIVQPGLRKTSSMKRSKSMDCSSPSISEPMLLSVVWLLRTQAGRTPFATGR